MANKKERQLIKWLATKNDWVVSAEIAQYMGVSQRMVRKYVKQINEDESQEITIISSTKGYRISQKEQAERIEESERPKLPETNEERIRFMTYKLLTHNTQAIHYSHLAGELFVSELTIKNDLRKIKDFLEKYGIQLKRREGFVEIIGKERDKRKVMRELAFEEAGSKLFSFEDVTEFNIGISRVAIQSMVSDILEKHRYFINEYMMNDLILHMIIAIHRIQQNHEIKRIDQKEQVFQAKEYAIAKEIAEAIEQFLQMTFEENEIYYLALLLIGNTSILNYDNIKLSELNEYIDQEYLELVEEIIKEVYSNYYIDLWEEQFIVKFIIHLRNLLNRASYKKYSRNPLTEEIKFSYPLIYDISVFIAGELKQKTGIDINEDEIAYIALHIGSHMEMQKKSLNQIRCVMICPQYYDMHMQMSRKIQEHFGDTLRIVQAITKVTDITHLDKTVDFVITTTVLPTDLSLPSVFVQPFLKRKDLMVIHQEIENFQQDKMKQELRSYLDWYFPEKLFFRNLGLSDKEDVIKFLTERFVEEEYAECDFLEAVMAREKLSSTAFNNSIAMPHTIRYSSIKTRISIVIEERPLIWDDSKVQIICLTAVNDKDRKFFGDFFQSLIGILSNSENVQLILKSQTYEAFIDCLMTLMSS